MEMNPLGVQYECATNGCESTTYSLFFEKVSDRWATVKVYADDDGDWQLANGDTPEYKIELLHFCPRCLEKYMSIDAETVASIEKTEKWVIENTRL